jgi:hypothetical protein
VLVSVCWRRDEGGCAGSGHRSGGRQPTTRRCAGAGFYQQLGLTDAFEAHLAAAACSVCVMCTGVTATESCLHPAHGHGHRRAGGRAQRAHTLAAHTQAPKTPAEGEQQGTRKQCTLPLHCEGAHTLNTAPPSTSGGCCCGCTAPARGGGDTVQAGMDGCPKNVARWARQCIAAWRGPNDQLQVRL